MTDKPDFDQLNKHVSEWARYQAQKLKRQVGTLTLKDKHALHKAALAAAKNPNYNPLQKSIGADLERDKVLSTVGRINFRFAKQGIYLEHGVGKGRKVGSAAARPKPWLKPVLDPALQELADRVAESYADAAAGEINLSIPGIISRKIKIKNG